MANRTKVQWLQELCDQLMTLDTIQYATYLTKSTDLAERNSPYVSVVTIGESLQSKDSFSERYSTQLALYILTREQDCAIEDIIEDIKGLLRTVDLGSNIYQVNYIGTQVVAIEDYNDTDGSKFSSTRLDVEVIWSTTYTASSASTLPAYGLTEPLATAHYKMYALLYSGSYSSQPLGTNVYDSQYTANVSIPASSGSILVGAISDSPLHESTSRFVGDHLIELSVDVVTGYAGQTPNLHKTMRLVDEVVNKIMTNYDLGNAYRGPINNNSIVIPQVTALIPESNCVGARIQLVVSKAIMYDQA